MTTYTLWDLPSSSLLVQTHAIGELADSAQAFIEDNGEGALEDLLLGIERGDDRTAEFSGRHILEVISREKKEQRSA
jgi:hypothetical protein